MQQLGPNAWHLHHRRREGSSIYTHGSDGSRGSVACISSHETLFLPPPGPVCFRLFPLPWRSEMAEASRTVHSCVCLSCRFGHDQTSGGTDALPRNSRQVTNQSFRRMFYSQVCTRLRNSWYKVGRAKNRSCVSRGAAHVLRSTKRNVAF